MSTSYFRYDLWAKTAQGPALAGLNVWVCSQPTMNTMLVPPSPLAAIYSDNQGANSITQPIQTDGFGHAFFYVASGLYTVILAIGGSIYQVLPDQAIGTLGGINGIIVVGTPAAGQVLTATSSTSAAWENVVGEVINFPAIPNQFLNSYNSATGLLTSAQPLLSGIGNPTSSVDFIFNAFTFIRSYSETQQWNESLVNTTLATASANVASPMLALIGAVYNGSISIPDAWGLSSVVGNGPNPTSTLTFQNVGGSGLASVSVPNLIVLSNVTISGELFDNNGSHGTNGEVLTATNSGFVWSAAPAAPTLMGSGLVTIVTSSNTSTITVLGSGSTKTAATAEPNLSLAPAGDVVTTDGSGNVQDSGVPLSSFATIVNAVVKNPTANQTITAFSLLPASGNLTQSLGSASAPWNMYPLQTNGGATITLYGSTDPYGGLIQNAINALPSGGTVDARATGVAAVPQGAIDAGAAGNKAITILLGAGTYTFTSITLRNSFKILGAGWATTGTIIQVSATTATALFFGPGAGNVNASGCVLSDLLIYGSTGGVLNPSPVNYLDCFLFDASASTAASNGGVWNSTFTRVASQGFGGSHWHIKGASTAPGFAGINQLLTFNQVQVYVNFGTGMTGGYWGNGAGQAVRVEGANYQMFWYGCFLEGPNGNGSIDTTSGTQPAVFLGGGPGTATGLYPYGMHFLNTNIEGREVGVQLDGAQDVTFTKGHHEALYGFLLVTFGQNGAAISTFGVVVQDSSWNTNVGVNGGLGYIVNLNTAFCSGIRVHDNFYNGASAGPDNWLISSAVSQAATFNKNLANFVGAVNYGLPSVSSQAGGTGIPAVVARYDVATQGANIAAVTLFTPVVSGWYRIDSQEVLTRAATASSTLPSVSLTYTDADSSTVQIDQISASTATNTLGVCPTGSITFYAKVGTVIQFSTAAFASSGATSMQYALHVILEQIQ